MGFRSAYLAFTVIVLYTSIVQGIPRFTREPPSVLYVSNGGTARLVWDYNNIKNRSALFDPYSPEWSLYNSSGGKVLIGVDDGFNGFMFVINKGCPPRLRGRVSKESTATLVISNVTTADSGGYGCNLVLLSGSPIRSKVQLIVTDRPSFNNTINLTTLIIEGSRLHITCSATGDPMPNVTWIRIKERSVFISEGAGKAFLRFNNITRNQSGTYECQATNNPNEDPVTKKIEISVKFPLKPEKISAYDIKATSVLIKWTSPLDDAENHMIEYKIHINTIPHRENITKTTHFVMRGLKENTTYIVKVYARNAAGYGSPACTEFTTKERKIQVEKEIVKIKEPDVIAGVPKAGSFAGVIGVIIGIGLMSLVVLIVFMKKRWTKKSTKQRRQRNKHNEHFPGGIDTSRPPETSYADVDVSKEKELHTLKSLPVYAQVDKKKKRRPGEIVYAELEDMKTTKGPPTLAHRDLPPKYHGTQYADIKYCSSKCGTEEAYDPVYCNAK